MSNRKPAAPSSPFAPHAAGVYAVRSGDADRWRVLAREAGLQWFAVDASRLRDKDALLKAVGAALCFPDYFRRNWDAFEECLTDLEWLDERRSVLYLGPIDALATAAPKDLETFLAIVREASRASADSPRVLWVLVGASKAPAGLTMLALPG